MEKKKRPSAVVCQAADALVAKCLTAIRQLQPFISVRTFFFIMLFIFESTVRTAPVAPPCLPWGRAWLAHLQLLFHLTHHMTAAEHALLVKCDFY